MFNMPSTNIATVVLSTHIDKQQQFTIPTCISLLQTYNQTDDTFTSGGGEGGRVTPLFDLNGYVPLNGLCFPGS